MLKGDILPSLVYIKFEFDALKLNLYMFLAAPLPAICSQFSMELLVNAPEQ